MPKVKYTKQLIASVTKKHKAGYTLFSIGEEFNLRPGQIKYILYGRTKTRPKNKLTLTKEEIIANVGSMENHQKLTQNLTASPNLFQKGWQKLKSMLGLG
tara:strand:+ start:673 stop:972 length:300 start_codon:yes stop_codon:yes gene_type:complete